MQHGQEDGRAYSGMHRVGLRRHDRTQGIPVDGGGEQVEACDPEVLSLGAIADLVLMALGNGSAWRMPNGMGYRHGLATTTGGRARTPLTSGCDHPAATYDEARASYSRMADCLGGYRIGQTRIGSGSPFALSSLELCMLRLDSTAVWQLDYGRFGQVGPMGEATVEYPWHIAGGMRRV